VPAKAGDNRSPDQIPVSERDYYLERMYPSYGNLAPRDISSRAARRMCDEGRGVGPGGRGVYLDLADSIKRLGKDVIEERYGNLIEMYQRITAEDPYKVPMRIYPAVHYTMGGLWVDYDLMSNVPGLFVLGEANFSDHGANRLGASALMQGLADGYFVIPTTIGDYLANSKLGKITADRPEFTEARQATAAFTQKLLGVRGHRSVDSFHKALGLILWDNCGMGRTKESLTTAIQKVRTLRDEFWGDVRVPGDAADLNQELEKAGRVADYFEMGELLCRDALEREESCGGHFREEHQTEEGEAKRDDVNFCHAAVWEHAGPGKEAIRNVEPLTFEVVHLAQRSYK
jgi:succinate dehydrogenase / fumarate reductase flavoprotein subunit